MTVNQDSAWQPLKGVRVADFSVLLPGPLSTVLLADLGAEVVKIESPHGDPARRTRGDEVTAKLKSLIRAYTLEQWCQRLEGSDIPFEVCVTPAQAASSDHLRVRGRVAQQGDQQFVPFPVTVDGRLRPSVVRVSPRLGQETEDFFNEIQSAQQ